MLRISGARIGGTAPVAAAIARCRTTFRRKTALEAALSGAGKTVEKGRATNWRRAP